MSHRYIFIFVGSIKHIHLTARGVKGCAGCSLQHLFPIVMTFSSLFTYYASVFQPGDLHYSCRADALTSASSAHRAGAPAAPAQWAVMIWGDLCKIQTVLQSPGFIDVILSISLLHVTLPREIALEIKMLQSTECAGQDMYAELDLNSTKLHLIGQIHLMLPGRKLTWKCMVQCSLSGMEFSMFQQCVVRVDIE